ncbi:MAG: hypothetical protein SFZ03_03870 [Candidatus Melainabacteria bacterium]|nr:hypothetical protein [Candidatus Melainabacteria bacterium]
MHRPMTETCLSGWKHLQALLFCLQLPTSLWGRQLWLSGLMSSMLLFLLYQPALVQWALPANKDWSLADWQKPLQFYAETGVLQLICAGGLLGLSLRWQYQAQNLQRALAKLFWPAWLLLTWFPFILDLCQSQDVTRLGVPLLLLWVSSLFAGLLLQWLRAPRYVLKSVAWGAFLGVLATEVILFGLAGLPMLMIANAIGPMTEAEYWQTFGMALLYPVGWFPMTASYGALVGGLVGWYTRQQGWVKEQCALTQAVANHPDKLVS